MQYWLLKSEPFKYAWEQFKKDKRTFWDGVRNYQARNYLRAMQLNDLAVFYHSNEGKEIVGIAKVVQEHYPDPTATDGDWSVVEIAPYMELAKPIPLQTLREDEILSQMAIFKQMRLSVVSLSEQEFNRIITLGAAFEL